MERKRGAQPGNTNALKHGFYSTRFQTSDVASLMGTGPDLSDEINILRLIIRRLSGIVEESTSIQAALKASALIARSAARIGTLARTQRILSVDDEYKREWMERFEEILNIDLPEENMDEAEMDEEGVEQPADLPVPQPQAADAAEGPGGRGDPAKPEVLQRGFYTSFFKEGEIALLEQAGTDLYQEIDLLRLTIRRVFTTLSEAVSPEDTIKAYTVISDAAASIGSLIRTQRILAGNHSDYQRILEEALAEASKKVLSELGWSPP